MQDRFYPITLAIGELPEAARYAKGEAVLPVHLCPMIGQDRVQKSLRVLNNGAGEMDYQASFRTTSGGAFWRVRPSESEGVWLSWLLALGPPTR